MQTLMIRDGDLVLGPAGFATVSGTAKVFQDLSHAVREPYGSDRFHPRWGSVLPEMIGRRFTGEMRLLIASEITRLVQNYMLTHQEVMQRDAGAGRKQRYRTGEIVSEVKDIDAIPHPSWPDRIIVRATVVTLTGEQISLLSVVEA